MSSLTRETPTTPSITDKFTQAREQLIKILSHHMVQVADKTSLLTGTYSRSFLIDIAQTQWKKEARFQWQATVRESTLLHGDILTADIPERNNGPASYRDYGSTLLELGRDCQSQDPAQSQPEPEFDIDVPQANTHPWDARNELWHSDDIMSSSSIQCTTGPQYFQQTSKVRIGLFRLLSTPYPPNFPPFPPLLPQAPFRRIHPKLTRECY